LERPATVIATLNHENTALRAQLARQGTVVPIGAPSVITVILRASWFVDSCSVVNGQFELLSLCPRNR
jgi:hypothetical protein